MREAQMLNKARPHDEDADSSHQYAQHWSDQEQ